MKKRLFALVFFLALTLPAHARITLGVVPVAGGLFRSEAQAQQVAGFLEGKLRQEVAVRVFADEATLHEWLNRFRTVDIAVLRRAYLSRQPAGEFLLVADYWRRGQRGLPVDSVVARQGFNPALLGQVQKALLSLGSEGGTSAVLNELRLERFVLPGERPQPEPSPFAADSPAQAAVEAESVPGPEEATAPQPEPRKKTKVKANPKPEPKPKATAKPAPRPAPEPEPAPMAAAGEGAVAPRQEAAAVPANPSPPVAEAASPVAAATGEAAQDQSPQSAGSALYLLIVLLLAALLAAAVYLVWQLRRLSRTMLWFSGQQPADKENPPRQS